MCCVYLVAQSHPTLCDLMDSGLPDSSVHGDSPGKNTGVGCHTLLQGIFPTQGLNPGLPHCRWILYCLTHQGSPWLTSNGASAPVIPLDFSSHLSCSLQWLKPIFLSLLSSPFCSLSVSNLIYLLHRQKWKLSIRSSDNNSQLITWSPISICTILFLSSHLNRTGIPLKGQCQCLGPES